MSFVRFYRRHGKAACQPWSFSICLIQNGSLTLGKGEPYMKQITRRDRLKIYRDLLSILSEEASKGKIVLTSVQMRLNVPFDRLRNYIAELYNLNLIEDEESLKLTEKGKEFILGYEKILDFMEQMGVAYR